jgi:hypothetical protein
MSWYDIIDKIYLLTTSKTTRIDSFMKNIQNVSIDPKVIKVIMMEIGGTYKNINKYDIQYEKDLEVDSNIPKDKMHHLKAGYSYKLICKDALSKGYNKILIFEDDAELIDISKDKIDKILKWIKNNDWDLFYLGHIAAAPQFLINNYIVRTCGSVQCHAVCYNKKIMELISSKFKAGADFNYFQIRDHSKEYFSIDNFLRVECLHIKAYACRPSIFYQNVETFEIGEARKFGIYPDSSISNWANDVNNCILWVSYLIILIPIIFLIILYRLFERR